MLITDKLHIPVWGTFITTPVINKESASVNIRVDVEMIILKLNRVEYILTFMMRIIKSSHSEHSF